MFCHNKPLFRARSEELGRLAHSVYNRTDAWKTDFNLLIRDSASPRPKMYWTLKEICKTGF